MDCKDWLCCHDGWAAEQDHDSLHAPKNNPDILWEEGDIDDSPESAWSMDCWDVILIIMALPRQNILEDIITPGAGDLWIGVCAYCVVGSRIAVEAMQVVCINLGVCLVVVAGCLHAPPGSFRSTPLVRVPANMQNVTNWQLYV